MAFYLASLHADGRTSNWRKNIARSVVLAPLLWLAWAAVLNPAVRSTVGYFILATLLMAAFVVAILLASVALNWVWENLW